MFTSLSSKGCLRASKVFLLNSGISSKNNTPLWASDTAPGFGIVPPPIKDTSEALLCGAAKGLCFIREFFKRPATLYIFDTSKDSTSSKGGIMLGNLLASIDFPLPGGPIKSML